MRIAPALAAVVAALCSAQAAFAQASQLPPVPFYDWTGVYVGANLGYASASITDTTTSGGTSTSSSQTMAGFIGGGQLGANFQWNHTVFGVEVDADASSQKTSSNTLTATMSSFVTARARIGYAYDRLHYYVTGGGVTSSSRAREPRPIRRALRSPRREPRGERHGSRAPGPNPRSRRT